tara:strand:- start:150 stop:632 length:483 start_codon:yes stop_codon:yes gene_type:complete
MEEQPKATEEKKEEKEVKRNWLGQPKKDKKEEKEDQDERLAALSTLVRLGILIWSGGILTLAYVELPEALKIPKQDLDPTFIASVFTGVLATFGVQTAKKGSMASGGGGISKADLEKLIAAAAQTAPAQTIRIEQAPLTIGTQPPSVDDGAPPVVPPKKS